MVVVRRDLLGLRRLPPLGTPFHMPRTRCTDPGGSSAFQSRAHPIGPGTEKTHARQIGCPRNEIEAVLGIHGNAVPASHSDAVMCDEIRHVGHHKVSILQSTFAADGNRRSQRHDGRVPNVRISVRYACENHDLAFLSGSRQDSTHQP